jgi:hypothetical protein
MFSMNVYKKIHMDINTWCIPSRNISICSKTPPYVNHFRAFFKSSNLLAYSTSVMFLILSTITSRLVWPLYGDEPPAKPYVCTLKFVPIHTHIFICIYIYMYIHVYTSVYVCIYLYIHIELYIYSHIYAYTYTS